MRRRRRGKIVATLGPSTSSESRIRALFDAGVDVFRFNFSHGSHADHKDRYRIVRALEDETDRPIGVLGDLQGPKLRIATFDGGSATLEPGRRFRIDADPTPGNGERVGLPHPEIFAASEPGMLLLLDDGRVRLRIEECGADFAETTVLTGGKLSDRKGVNVPDVVLDLQAITDKDRADLAFALDLGVDWVALSFVQRPEDIAEARRLVAGRAAVMAKLEKPSAIRHLHEIIEMSDGIMVARGDLGVEMPPEDVPILQRRIVSSCRELGKPVIVATQMLESMVSAPAPTRAEASDVATAVYDSADAVMLSAETAAGQYPVESVEMMDRIIRRVEADDSYRLVMDAHHPPREATAADAISAAARQTAETIGAAAIVTYTTSGSTTFRAARERPAVPILGLTARLGTARRLALLWGVHPVHTSDVSNFQAMVEKACEMAKREEFAEVGRTLVITAGVPFGTPGATNVLRIARVA